jgi:hypothetical protein
MKLTFETPNLTTGQKVGTGLLCSCASALFTVPAWLAPWADVSAVQALGGLTLPAGVALLFWTIKGSVDEHDERRRDQLDASARLGEAQVRMAERMRRAEREAQGLRVAMRERRAGQRRRRVIEGEVVR